MTTKQLPPSHHGVYCIRNMYGLSVATDCLTRYVRRFGSDPGCFNMLGVLLERENLLRTSYDVLAKAAELSTAPEQRNKVLQNAGRVALKMKAYDKAKTCFGACDGRRDVYGQLGLALSCEKLGLNQEAYDGYRQAFELSDNDNQRSQILTAMATIAYKVHGADASKTLLLKASQLQPVSVHALFSLCVLGLQQSDSTLISASLQEMEKYQRQNPNRDLDHHLADMASLKALVLVLKGDRLGAKRVLTSAVHLYPHLSGLWAKLALHLLEYHPGNGREASSVCFRIAVALARSETSAHSEEVSVMTDANGRQAEMTCLIALSHVVNGDLPRAIQAASKAVHDYPDSAQTWCVLAAAVGLQGRSNRQLLQHASKMEGSSEKLKQWIAKQLS